jgi:hypothetical protein
MTSKYMSRQYDPIVPEVIGICEEFNRERFSIQWLSDEIKMHVEPGTSTVFRKITSDGYVM